MITGIRRAKSPNNILGEPKFMIIEKFSRGAKITTGLYITTVFNVTYENNEIQK